jgi:hypothetical protein
MSSAINDSTNRLEIPRPTIATPEQCQYNNEYQASVRQCKRHLLNHDITDESSSLLIEDPDIDNGSRMELAELLIRNQDRIMAAQAARFLADDQLDINNAGDLLVKTIATPPELIQGILYQGGKMSFNASSKMGKTWSLLHLGISMNEGMDWFGFKTTKTRVLFINPELQNFSLEKRVQLIARNMSGTVTLENFDYITTRGKQISADKLLPKLESQIRSGQYGAILLDSIYKLYPSNVEENSNSDVGRFLNTLEQLALKANAAVIYSHHYSKGNQANKAAIDRSSGGGAWGRDPDTVVSVTEHDTESCFTVECGLRDFEKQEPFVIRVNWPNVFRDAALDPKKLKTTQYGSKYSVDTLLARMAVRSYTATELQKELKRDLDMAQGSFYALWSEVKVTEGVKQGVDNKWSYRHPTGNPANN